MKEIYSNINIIGGGLIGATLAHSLSSLDLKIVITEKKGAYTNLNYNDYRTVAISEGTKKFFEKINFWNDIKKNAQPIKKIKVIDRKISNSLEFDNNRRSSNLGYIIKNKYILHAIYNKLKKSKNVKLINDSNITNFQYENDLIVTNLNDCKIISNLNIAADGKHSFVRNLFKTPVYTKNYNKNALVLTFTHSRDHNSTAFEFFYKNGPLAILPMKNIKNQHASSIVWTNENYYLKELLKLDNEKLANILNSNTFHSVGRINKILTKQLFPLSAHLNTKFYENKTIYIGDAAHSFHPIAGQGWNLGIKDIENLFYLIQKYKSLGIEIGDSIFCRKYHSDNFYNAYKLYQITDKLDNIFQIQNPFIGLLRSTGLNLIQKNKKINNMISDFAMGIN